jgi:hypothetical protein
MALGSDVKVRPFSVCVDEDITKNRQQLKGEDGVR